MLKGEALDLRARGEAAEGDSNNAGLREVQGAEGADICCDCKSMLSSCAGVGSPVSGGIYVDFEEDGMLTCNRTGVRGGV
jgi:hypothetical protein